VAADIADVMTMAKRPVFQSPASTLVHEPAISAGDRVSRVFIRLKVKDQPGVIAAVSETLAEAGVSIDGFLQKPSQGEGAVPIVLTTHATAESVVLEAVERIARLPAMLERPKLLRIARV
jgi:homoserine dehydrogenase